MLSDNLKKIRKDNNLSQEQLAEKLGVSRQSVSKWENGEAYPEMDKVLQICKMFNLNIDELLNQDIKEIVEEKQSRINVDKYVGDFLDYITKTINLFSSMKFKDIFKCLFEQAVISVSILIVVLILGMLLGNLFHGIFFFIPSDYYYSVYNLFSSVYFVFAFIVGLCLMLHIFKVRYLDYFVVVEKEDVKDDKVVVKEEKINNDKIFSRKEEKVIIRDPKDSKNGFISLLVRSILFMIKFFTFWIGVLFSISLVVLVCIFVLLFLISKSGLVFIGSLLIIISLILINLIFLNLIFNFLKSTKSKIKLLMFIFVISLILTGIGSGLFCIGLLDFKHVSYNDNPYIVEKTEYIEMKSGMFIDYYYGYIKYIESNNNNLKIVYTHPDFYDISYAIDTDNTIWFNQVNFDVIKVIKQVLGDINERRIIDYDNYEIKVYTTKENIKKLEENRINYYNIGR